MGFVNAQFVQHETLSTDLPLRCAIALFLCYHLMCWRFAVACITATLAKANRRGRVLCAAGQPANRNSWGSSFDAPPQQ